MYYILRTKQFNLIFFCAVIGADDCCAWCCLSCYSPKMACEHKKYLDPNRHDLVHHTFLILLILHRKSCQIQGFFFSHLQTPIILCHNTVWPVIAKGMLCIAALSRVHVQQITLWGSIVWHHQDRTDAAKKEFLYLFLIKVVSAKISSGSTMWILVLWDSATTCTISA